MTRRYLLLDISFFQKAGVSFAATPTVTWLNSSTLGWVGRRPGRGMASSFRAPYCQVLLALFLTLCCAHYPATAFNLAAEPLSVRLFEAHSPVKCIYIFAPFAMVRNGRVTRIDFCCRAECKGGKLRINRMGDKEGGVADISRVLSIRPIGTKSITLKIDGIAPRFYRGEINLSVGVNGEVRAINLVSRLDYIAGVVASETLPNWPDEMLKAQAVLAYTLVCRTKSNQTIGDSTQSQSYLGSQCESSRVKTLVGTVLGKILCYQGIPIEVYYHSTCGGATSSGAQFFHLKSRKCVYLNAVKCSHCYLSPFFASTKTMIPLDVFAKTFGDNVPIITGADAVGRPLTVKLADGRCLTGYELWLLLGQKFGWDKAPGTRMSFAKSVSESILITSIGAGHGVGLCQWGAAQLAREGRSYKEILAYYFPGCVVH